MAYLCSKINVQKRTCEIEIAMHLWIALDVLKSNIRHALFHTKLHILEFNQNYLIRRQFVYQCQGCRLSMIVTATKVNRNPPKAAIVAVVYTTKFPLALYTKISTCKGKQHICTHKFSSIQINTQCKYKGRIRNYTQSVTLQYGNNVIHLHLCDTLFHCQRYEKK